MANISFKNVVKEFPGGVIAVHDFTLDIADKGFVVLVGPSGCGKSTTLRMLAGLEEISSGEILINGKVVNDVPPKDRDIAMVFQNYALYPHMTVYKNMAFALELKKEPKEEIDRKVREAAKILDIEHLLDRKPKALSGGQRQRVALGRAMVRNPSVFLLDEPLSNLDAKLRSSMRTEIAKLHKRLDSTFIYVTHDQTEAMTMGDTIVVMKDGFIQQVDAPQYLYDHPRNMFVAGFIGTPQMNFLDTVLRKDEKGLYIEVGETKFHIDPKRLENKDLSNYADKTVVLGVRPEDVNESEDKSAPAINAVVEVRELMGAEVYLYLNFKDYKITARVPNSTQAQMDQTISITFDTNKIHLFDKETQDTLL